MAAPTTYADVARQAHQRLQSQAAAARARLQAQKRGAYEQVSTQLRPFKSELEEARQQQLAIVRGQTQELQRQADIFPRAPITSIAKRYKSRVTGKVGEAYREHKGKITAAETEAKSEIDKAVADAEQQLAAQVAIAERNIDKFGQQASVAAEAARKEPGDWFAAFDPEIGLYYIPQSWRDANPNKSSDDYLEEVAGLPRLTHEQRLLKEGWFPGYSTSEAEKKLGIIGDRIIAPEIVKLPEIKMPELDLSEAAKAKAHELAESTGLSYTAIFQSVKAHPEEYGLVPYSEIIDKYRQEGYQYGTAADLARFDVSGKLYEDKAGANIGLHSIRLSAGDVLDKAAYEELSVDAQAKINQMGIEGYNTFLKEDTFTLPTGELMSKEVFSRLDPKHQNELYDIGIEKFNEKYAPATKGEIVKETGLSLIPVYGTIRLAQKGAPAWEVALSAGLDLLWIIPPARLLAAGARGGVGLGRAIGKIALAEIKAPVTMLLHPIKTIKFAADPIETLVRLRKIPLESMEVSFHTIKIPSALSRLSGLPKTSASLQEALQASKKLASKAIWGEKPIFTGTETIFKMPIAELQKIAPVAMHMSPDIRPFLHGGKVTKTLSLAPNLHTRFTYATSMGLVPKSGMPGALLIRDKKLLRALKMGRIDPETGKLVPYRGTAEVEARLFEGIELPEPVQLLMTRDISGRKLTILVFGDKLTTKELLKLKLLAPKATIKQIFQKPYAKATPRVELVNKLTGIDSQLATLTKQVKRIKGPRKTELRAQAAKLEAERARLVDAINNMPDRAPIRAMLMNTSGIPYAKLVEELTRAYFEAHRRGTALPTMRAVSRVPKRIPPRKPAERVPPGVARVTPAPPYKPIPPPYKPVPPPYKPPVPPAVPPVKPPVPPAVPPRIPPLAPGYPPPPTPARLVKPELEEEPARKRKFPLGSVCWRQGIFWITIFPPYKKGNIMYTRKPPRGVSVAKGPKSAYKTVTKLGFQVPDKVLHDMGIMDVVVTKKGQEIKFKRDIKQRTKLGYAEGVPPGIKMGKLG